MRAEDIGHAEGEFNRQLGNRARSLRQSKRMTQAEVARKLGKSRSAVANFEAGRHIFATFTLSQLAAMLDVHITNLLPHGDGPELPPHEVEAWIARVVGAAR